MEVITGSPEETFAIGRDLGKRLPDGSVLCLYGELGAGKTTMIKGIASGVAEINPSTISSPTFVYLNIYRGKRTFYHFDLYRLRDVDEFLSMGFEEYLEAGGVCCIEWAERIAPILPEHVIRVELSHVGETERRLKVEEL